MEQTESQGWVTLVGEHILDVCCFMAMCPRHRRLAGLDVVHDTGRCQLICPLICQDACIICQDGPASGSAGSEV